MPPAKPIPLEELEMLTKQEVCRLLKISLRKLHYLIARHELLPSRYVGSSPRWTKQAIRDYVGL